MPLNFIYLDHVGVGVREPQRSIDSMSYAVIRGI